MATEAFASCASIAITMMPPGMAQKKPVRESVPASLVNTGTTAIPATMDTTPPKQQHRQAPVTAASTGPEKVAPSAKPRNTSPAGRAQTGIATGRCQASSAVASMAPIIQASGTRSRCSTAPPSAAMKAVRRWVRSGDSPGAGCEAEDNGPTIAPGRRSVKPGTEAGSEPAIA